MERLQQGRNLLKHKAMHCQGPLFVVLEHAVGYVIPVTMLAAGIVCGDTVMLRNSSGDQKRSLYQRISGTDIHVVF